MDAKPPSISELLHSDRRRGAAHGALHEPIHPSVQYGFERTADLIGVFQGTHKGAFNYARQGTPTTAALEAKITRLEQGVGSVCFATGMAAIGATFLTLLKAGDHLVASRFLFGNTNSVMDTLAGFDIDVSLVDATSAEAVAQALRPNTRLVFVETLANPRTQVPDLAGIGALCRQHGLLYVVDNTVTSPALFRPKDVGAGLVINSLSKTLAGHGSALGGSVTDTGLFDWAGYPNIADAYRTLPSAAQGLQQIRKKGLRDLGGSLSSDQAHRISLGMDTLALRVRQTSGTALALARFLEAHAAVDAVHYPGLPTHAQHAVAAQLFAASSWLLAFELADAAQTEAVLDRLRLAVKATGLGDTRTLVIPVAPTIYWEAGPEVRRAMGIADGLVRVSVGLEDTDELIADFAQALEG